MTPGLFISVEGGDGAGKTTQISAIAEYYRRDGRDICITREPGGTALAEQIREWVISPPADAHDNNALTELLLMMSARADHVHRVIRPALAGGKVVICDRFSDSSIAYQGYGRGLDVERIIDIADMIHADCWPDITLYLNLPLELSKARISQRNQDGNDRFENEDDAFKIRVQQGFIALATRFRARYHVIDASQDVDSVTRAIHQVLAAHAEAQ